jgi:hypothetical protein
LPNTAYFASFDGVNVVSGTGLVFVPQAFGSMRTSGEPSNPFWT